MQRTRMKSTALTAKAAQKRNNSAEIVAEHDDMIAEMLYEVTMLAFGEEVL